MLGKFLILAFVPLLCGILLAGGVAYFEQDRIIGKPDGLPDSTGSPGLVKKTTVLFKTEQKFKTALSTATGALTAYCITRKIEQRKQLDAAIDELPKLSKTIGGQRQNVFGTNVPDQRMDNLPNEVIKSIHELEKAVDQGESEDKLSSMASKAGSGMMLIFEEFADIAVNDGVKFLFLFLTPAAEGIIAGSSLVLLLTIISIGGFSWSCHQRVKIIERNLKNLADGTQLSPQIKGGRDAISKIDKLVHELAEKLTTKTA